jgi:hypothetical protein
MEQLWAQSESVANPPGWQWSPDKNLVDYIRVLEDHLGISRQPIPEVANDIADNGLKPTVEQPVDGAAEDTP